MMSQKPNKRTGLWNSTSIKQKTLSDNTLRKYSRSDITKINPTEDDDEILVRKNSSDVAKNNLNSILLKIPTLSNVKDMNIGLLLNQFNSPDEVKQYETIWNQDLLFAEIINQLNTRKT